MSFGNKRGIIKTKKEYYPKPLLKISDSSLQCDNQLFTVTYLLEGIDIPRIHLLNAWPNLKLNFLTNFVQMTAIPL